MEHLLYLGTLIAVWIIVALAANFVVGYTGMLAMGQAAYLGVGAYVTATLNILLGINFYLALSVAVIASALVAAITLLPLLRIGSFYFALATLGVNFVFFDIFRNLGPRVEGTEGLYGLQLPGLFAAPGPRFATMLAIACACVLLCQRIVASPLGRCCARRATVRTHLRRSVRIRAAIGWSFGHSRGRSLDSLAAFTPPRCSTSIQRCSRLIPRSWSWSISASAGSRVPLAPCSGSFS